MVQVLRVGTFNVHGTHDGAPNRLRRIGCALGEMDPHVLALQEVLRDGDLVDTAADIARWTSWSGGRSYRTEFAYCHDFMEMYPEGVGVVSRLPLSRHRVVDLTCLEDGLRPVMPRNALVAELAVNGRPLVFGSVHLDHAADEGVRLAQAKKLARELGNAPRIILAGDFNDDEHSPALRWLKAQGFRDAYRACHGDTGVTFPSDAPLRRIDFVLVKGDFDIVSSTLVLSDPTLSDHVGLVVEVR